MSRVIIKGRAAGGGSITVDGAEISTAVRKVNVAMDPHNTIVTLELVHGAVELDLPDPEIVQKPAPLFEPNPYDGESDE